MNFSRIVVLRGTLSQENIQNNQNILVHKKLLNLNSEHQKLQDDESPKGQRRQVLRPFYRNLANFSNITSISNLLLDKRPNSQNNFYPNTFYIGLIISPYFIGLEKYSEDKSESGFKKPTFKWKPKD